MFLFYRSLVWQTKFWMALATLSYSFSSQSMSLNLKETNLYTKHTRLKNRNWWETDQLAIRKHDYSNLVVRAGPKPPTSVALTTRSRCLLLL